MKTKKRLGVLGGMGSEATQVFFKRIIDQTRAENDREHLDLVIYNHASLPDRTEYILSGREKELWEILEQDFEMLCSMGSDYIVVPCNTCHYFAESIKAKTGERFINMITETAGYAGAMGYQRVGIMGTTGTLRSGLYRNALSELGIEAVYPSDEKQAYVMRLIYDQIKKGSKGSLADFNAVVDELRAKGCDAVCLACTELSVFRENHMLTDTFFIDALDVLARSAITACGGALRNMQVEDEGL